MCSSLLIGLTSLVLATPIPGVPPDATLLPLFSLEQELPDFLIQNHTSAKWAVYDQTPLMDVSFQKTDWPNVYFKAPDSPWDWSGALGVAIDVYNPESAPVQVAMRIDNAGADGLHDCITVNALALPGQWTPVFAPLPSADTERFWGMRGIPLFGPVGTGKGIDPSRITAFQLFLPIPERPHQLFLSNFRLIQTPGPIGDAISFPFIDAFGQYQHADWPGKLHDTREWPQRIEAETADLNVEIPEWDEFGGWAAGPQREATGWFRTEQIDGTWWLITPTGHLFFSTGMDCLSTWNPTFVEGRDEWFEGLPPEDHPQFGPCYHRVDNAHSGADVIGGKGRTFDFYRANLMRKYGESWEKRWRETSYARMKSWGFNTIGNWSQGDILDNSPLPFVVNGAIHNVRRVEGGGGYWAKMTDPYDPAFPEKVESSLRGTLQAYKDNPRCIGYFVDNELAWEAVEQGSLSSPPEQPCRKAQIAMLTEKYGTIDAVNAAWEASATDWDALRAPEEPNAACAADLDEFVRAFALRYFHAVNDVIKRHAPKQLYLGCRFSTAPDTVVDAADDVCDVVSFNLYQTRIDCSRWTGANALSAPIIIGEFHFGALDRGMFHTGLVPTGSQEARAQSYIDYVRSVADCPAFVGCHWFQYVDEPTTGRWFDGENYNIGLVTIVDSPYPEMVAAARQVHAEVYRRRFERGR